MLAPEAPCPVCVSIHEVGPPAPPEPVPAALLGETSPPVRVLTEEAKARRVHEEWNVQEGDPQ